jgi:energy-coupling factor transporter ATP-binding protein EcfA2
MPTLQNPPSKYDNPFATCWTKPGAMSFEFSPDETTEQLVGKLAQCGWRGAIVGPHGSGKSTLLETLKPAIAAAGREIAAISLRDRQRRLPREVVESLNQRKHLGPIVIIVDGYEQLGWIERWRLTSLCHLKCAGLLVTSHTSTRLPTLIELTPNAALVSLLVARLCAEVSTPITVKDIDLKDLDASLACHGSNVREIFFDLYDRHERKRRAARTAPLATAY